MATRRETLTQLVAGTTFALTGGRRGAADEPAPSAQATAAAPRSGPARIKIGQIGVGHAHATKVTVYRQSPDY